LVARRCDADTDRLDVTGRSLRSRARQGGRVGGCVNATAARIGLVAEIQQFPALAKTFAHLIGVDMIVR
jgi:hypothetical protein